MVAEKASDHLLMVDLKAQYLRYKKEIDSALIQVVESAQYINGHQVQSFSNALESYLSVEKVIPCGNGTDALQLALMALDLQPGDEDIDSKTYNIDVDDIERRITPKTKVVLPVHLFGQPADMTSIMELANNHGLYVIEDVAQSLGASCMYKGVRYKAGTIGHIGCTSFFPSKNLACFGDGGACFTNDDYLGSRMKMLASHGAGKQYHHDIVGINSRLDTIQAAILNVKLPLLDDFITARRTVAGVYDSILKDVEQINIPYNAEGVLHSYNQYTIAVKNGKRDELKKKLELKGIPTRVYYPVPLHRQQAFSNYLDSNLSLPNAQIACKEVLSLPMHTEMSSDDARYIALSIKELLENL